ncbi:hypothetical protein [Pseudomonas boanensis]|uniref:hypothetical protein n=1 Tax=Metapseudomonas boanensis TaxID=2822138 RepID=UPI0035D41BAC
MTSMLRGSFCQPLLLLILSCLVGTASAVGFQLGETGGQLSVAPLPGPRVFGTDHDSELMPRPTAIAAVEAMDATYDLNTGRHTAAGLTNEQSQPLNFNC